MDHAHKFINILEPLSFAVILDVSIEVAVILEVGLGTDTISGTFFMSFVGLRFVLSFVSLKTWMYIRTSDLNLADDIRWNS